MSEESHAWTERESSNITSGRERLKLKTTKYYVVTLQVEETIHSQSGRDHSFTKYQKTNVGILYIYPALCTCRNKSEHTFSLPPLTHTLWIFTKGSETLSVWHMKWTEQPTSASKVWFRRCSSVSSCFCSCCLVEPGLCCVFHFVTIQFCCSGVTLTPRRICPQPINLEKPVNQTWSCDDIKL